MRSRIARRKTERVEIDQPGRPCHRGSGPYPPGIPHRQFGEVFNRKIVDYLIFARRFSKLCPGFRADVHGGGIGGRAAKCASAPTAWPWTATTRPCKPRSMSACSQKGAPLHRQQAAEVRQIKQSRFGALSEEAHEDAPTPQHRVTPNPKTPQRVAAPGCPELPPAAREHGRGPTETALGHSPGQPQGQRPSPPSGCRRLPRWPRVSKSSAAAPFRCPVAAY